MFAVALEDGRFDYEASYALERRHREGTIALWRKISTVEDAEWTTRYHDPDPARKAFGGRVVVELDSRAETVTDEIAVADAHPAGSRPFDRSRYIEKFRALTTGVISPEEQERFLALSSRLVDLTPGEKSTGSRSPRRIPVSSARSRWRGSSDAPCDRETATSRRHRLPGGTVLGPVAAIPRCLQSLTALPHRRARV